MKKYKILIAAAAILTAVSAVKAETLIDFDGKAVSVNPGTAGSVSAFALLAGGASGAQVPGEIGIPMRVFSAPEQEAMDKTITGSIASARKRGYVELAAGLDCLLKSGTAEQKSEFVNWDAAKPYSLPAACSAKAVPQPAEKGVLNWICRTVTEIIIRNVCKPNADGELECMDQPVTALRQACGWE